MPDKFGKEEILRKQLLAAERSHLDLSLDFILSNAVVICRGWVIE